MSKYARIARLWLPITVVAFTLESCGEVGPSSAALRAENDSLKKALTATLQELDDLKYGPDRLLAAAMKAMEDSAFDLVIAKSNDLIGRHPSARETDAARKLLLAARAARTEQERQARIAAERVRKLEEARLEGALKAMRVKKDDVKEVTWYRDSSSPEYNNSRSDIHLYMGDDARSSPWLRFRIVYVAEDWLFIESYTIKVDGQTYTIPAGHFEVERDNGYSGIWEWYDVSAGPTELQIARAIANSQKAVIRHEGKQYYKDRTVTAREKRAMKNVLAAHEALVKAGR